MRYLLVLTWFTVPLLGSTGCDTGAASSQTAAQPVVDSIFSRGESLERFRRGIDSVAGLQGGAPSRQELVARFVTALETADTNALRALVMTRAEYAWIYYPTTPQGLPPYDLAPDLLWFMIENRGRQGIVTALQKRGGRDLGYRDSSCDPTPSIEGANRIWGPCTIHRRNERGEAAGERLFGSIIERDGRFKFVNYANKFD